MGPKRFSELPITIDELPHIDVVLITHDHHDHLEPKTINSLTAGMAVSESILSL